MRLIAVTALGLAIAAGGCNSPDSTASASATPHEQEQEADPPRRIRRLPAPWAHHTGRMAFVLGYDEGTVAAKETGKPPMYFFTSNWCEPCKKLANESFNDDEIVRLVERRFTPVLVDGDSETERALTRRYSVAAYPNLVFVDAQGDLVANVTGYAPKDRVLQAAQQAARKVSLEPPAEAAFLSPPANATR